MQILTIIELFVNPRNIVYLHFLNSILFAYNKKVRRLFSLFFFEIIFERLIFKIINFIESRTINQEFSIPTTIIRRKNYERFFFTFFLPHSSKQLAILTPARTNNRWLTAARDFLQRCFAITIIIKKEGVSSGGGEGTDEIINKDNSRKRERRREQWGREGRNSFRLC